MSESGRRSRLNWRERPYTARKYGAQVTISIPLELEKVVLGKQYVWRVLPGGKLELTPVETDETVPTP